MLGLGPLRRLAGVTLIGQRSVLVFGARKMASSADAVTGQLERMEVTEKGSAKQHPKKKTELSSHPMEVGETLPQYLCSV